MLIAIDDEETTLDAEMNAEYEASVEYCNQNPWACGQEPALDQPRGGPSVSIAVYAQPCSVEFWNFAGAIVSTTGAVVAGVAALLGAPMSGGSFAAGSRCHGGCSGGRPDDLLLCRNGAARVQEESNAIAKGDGCDQ